MISQADTLVREPSSWPTIWGLDPVQSHDRFWAARGVQVVRQGEPSVIVPDAELFLLTDPRTLTIFRLTRPVEVLSWIKPDILFIRLSDERSRGYREHVLTGPGDRFLRFQRTYGGSDSRLARVALTSEPRLALLWQKAPDPHAGWKAVRAEAKRSARSAMRISGRAYHRSDPQEVVHFLQQLMQVWTQPDSTIGRAQHRHGSIWADVQAPSPPHTPTSVGPVWVGAGRQLDGRHAIVGPAIFWDDPAARPALDKLVWQEIEPAVNYSRPIHPRPVPPLARAAKRIFDILFASLALLCTLPLYPFIMLAIWLEDGLPFFFSHKRETLHGREFGCIKFRSMCRDADRIKAQLMQRNRSDGPQFHMDDDPRLTRMGRFLRNTNLDELPQFINVLLGHMSVVGPRPSPRSENQYCPGWREARLSVRPGITGLWQVRRTRRAGQDFQEWIRYDLEYVEKASWWLDLKIIYETIRVLVRGIMRS